MLLGSHLSIAGGLHNALLEARRYRFPTLAMFVRNQRQWACPPLEVEAVEHFRGLRRKLGIGPVAAHGSYLLNLCGDDEIRQKSIKAVAEDLDRCRRLEIDYLVIHPGSHDDPREGVRLIAEGLSEAIRAATPTGPAILLETTAGAGRSLGGRFEELAEVLALLERRARFGVCLDTCHVFAAGYDIRTAQVYADTMRRFDEAIGLEHLKLIHVNDSKGDLGSRLDRHEHIGKGKIGLGGFANFARDPRLEAVPFILETPKEKDTRGRDWDRLNAQTLRRLAKRHVPASRDTPLEQESRRK